MLRASKVSARASKIVRRMPPPPFCLLLYRRAAKLQKVSTAPVYRGGAACWHASLTSETRYAGSTPCLHDRPWPHRGIASTSPAVVGLTGSLVVARAMKPPVTRRAVEPEIVAVQQAPGWWHSLAPQSKDWNHSLWRIVVQRPAPGFVAALAKRAFGQSMRWARSVRHMKTQMPALGFVAALAKPALGQPKGWTRSVRQIMARYAHDQSKGWNRAAPQVQSKWPDST